MSTDYARAARELSRALTAKGWNPADLAREAKVDEGTVLDFLNGHRKPQMKTRGKFESAVGWPAGTLDDIANGGDTPIAERSSDERPALSVVPAIVAEPQATEEENEVLAAVQRDPFLDEDAKAHYLNQYELLREMSARRRAAADAGTASREALPYVARGKATGKVSPEKNRELEELARQTSADTDDQSD